MASSKRKIAVLDFETEQFKKARVPKPFACQFLSPDISRQFWGMNCADQLVAFLDSLPDEYIIFAHNGGKFDFFFLFDYVDNPIVIINGRLTKASLCHHVLQDSFSIMPIALAEMDKTQSGKKKIDYGKFELHLIEKHKAEILEYLDADCRVLLDKVLAFVDRFGIKLTVGGTAMKELKKLHEFARMSPEHDATYRDYYYGGRVQCFDPGQKRGPWKVFDVNSMYPHVMRNYRHPVNNNWEVSRSLPVGFERPYFVHFEGESLGALPVRSKTGIDFPSGRGEFKACSHELEVALKYGMVTIDRVIECHIANEWISFVAYVDYWYEQKVLCKKANDRTGELFAKFMLNAAYGKFGTNPENFYDWTIVRTDDKGYLIIDGIRKKLTYSDLEGAGMEIYAVNPSFQLWRKPTFVHANSYFDVSIAASITSASRAVLLDAITKAVDPIYCDTDSLICRDLEADHDPHKLGAWKLEVTADNAAIAGKKLYALWNDDNRPLWPNLPDKPHKVVSKGGTLTLPLLLELCAGKEIEFERDVPSFKFTGKHEFVKRRFNRTAA